MICIQGTWLKPQLDFVIKGYNAIKRDREFGRGVGVNMNQLPLKYGLKEVV